MYQLHYFPANASAAPHMVLEEIGVSYDLVLIDRARNAQEVQRVSQDQSERTYPDPG